VNCHDGYKNTISCKKSRGLHARAQAPKTYLKPKLFEGQSLQAVLRRIHDMVYVKPVGLERNKEKLEEEGNV